MKAHRHFPILAATALAGLGLVTLSGAAIAAGQGMSDNTMSHNAMSHNGMSHNAMSNSQSMSKSKVKAIQSALKEKGMDVNTDGVMGPNTMQALRKYQQRNGLKPTGRPDQATRKSLGVGMGSMESNSMTKQ